MGTTRVRHNLAKYRFRAAAHYTRQCFRLEEKYPHDENRPIEHQWYATDAITNSFAGVEATINEFLQDIIDGYDYISNEMKDNELCSVLDNENDIMQEKTLVKYQRILSLSKNDTFEKGLEPYQNVEDLRYLRNQLVHFKPEWDSEKGHHDKVEKRLRSYNFEVSPFHTEPDPFFPLGCLGHGGAEWAVESSTDFVRAFHEKLGVSRHILDVIDELNTR